MMKLIDYLSLDNVYDVRTQCLQKYHHRGQSHNSRYQDINIIDSGGRAGGDLDGHIVGHLEFGILQPWNI